MRSVRKFGDFFSQLKDCLLPQRTEVVFIYVVLGNFVSLMSIYVHLSYVLCSF